MNTTLHTQAPEHPGFLADILADPGNVGPRLVYADWLEDQGDRERADFIREPFGLGPRVPSTRSKEYRRRLALVARSLAGVFPRSCHLYLSTFSELRTGQTLSELMARTYWAARPGEVCLVVRHGFVTEVGCSERQFFKAAGRLFRAQPVVDVRLYASPAETCDYPAIGVRGRAWLARPGGARLFGGIDRRLFALLPGGQPFRTHGDRGPEGRAYPDDGAWLALSAACVAWGRQQAGLTTSAGRQEGPEPLRR